jgi:hypothetical protein
MPAGPSIVDMISNAAVYLGASRFLAGLRRAPEADLPFTQARDNFYLAARSGLDAHIVWLDGREVEVRTLLLDEILHMAREGLLLLGADEDDIERYLSIAQMHVRTGQNGAAWQRAHAEKHACDFFRLTADYLEHQRSAMPVLAAVRKRAYLAIGRGFAPPLMAQGFCGPPDGFRCCERAAQNGGSSGLGTYPVDMVERCSRRTVWISVR